MLAIDCSKIEYRPTGPGRWLLNILRYWPDDFPVRLYFRRQIPSRDFFRKSCFQLSIVKGQLSRVDPLWRHFLLPRALKRDKVTLLFEPFYIPLLMWPPEQTVLCIADISYKRHPEWFPWRSQLRWFPSRLVKRVRHIFTTSEFSKREIMDYYDIPEERITVTLLAADEKFKPRDVGKVSPYFLFWGDLNTRRHPREMIEAFVRCQWSMVNGQMSFVIVGRDITNPPQHISQRVQEANRILGRRAIVHYEYPNDEELLRLIQGALAAIYLSDYEGFGLPVLEAMACGVPVITSRVAPLTEVGGEAAYYIKDNSDIEEIKNAMSKLAEGEDFRKTLGLRGLERARKFSWAKTSMITIELLRNLSRM